VSGTVARYGVLGALIGAMAAVPGGEGCPRLIREHARESSP
jgi:hypothetical protein